MSSTSIITGTTPGGETRFAAVDPAASYVKGQVCKMRLAALLAPYKTSADAEAALSEAGAVVEEGGGK